MDAFRTYLDESGEGVSNSALRIELACDFEAGIDRRITAVHFACGPP